MDESAQTRLATMFDAATLQSMESLESALRSCTDRLALRGIETPEEVATALCAEMEQESIRVQTLILRQPPKQLLGYIWSMHFVSILGEMREEGERYRPNKKLVDTMQFVFEFVHAAWSSSAQPWDEGNNLNETEVGEVFNTISELRNLAMLYCMMRSRGIAADGGNPHRGHSVFRAMATWINLRGRRYQMLEEEFLKFVLLPHNDALRKRYGMGADDIAAGVQAIADASRLGMARAVDVIEQGMKAAEGSGGLGGLSTEAVRALQDAMDDLLNGGVCNLSRQTDLTKPLLQDLSYLPGENTEFMAEGALRGTPLRTLPALVKPGIKLGDDYYIADGQFVRDVAYRCVQRGLLARDPGYREEWNRRQKRVVEDAFVQILTSQLKEAAVYHSVHFREPKSGNWVETDLVVAMEDVLVVVEAKAGGMAMESPAVDLDRHMASVNRLIVKAHRQCERFLEYMASASSKPIYALRGGQYVKVADLCLTAFRVVLPIGLTVESLSPFSTSLHDLEAIGPLLEKHGFMSIAVDDLLVLKRFLRTTGELFHYLEVRQQAGVVPETMLLDETEYLGAYISRNRFDTDLRAQREQAPFVLWNSFADIVDRYFEGDDAGVGRVPRQSYPAELAAILRVLDKNRPSGWLEMDAAIRDLGSEERNNLSTSIVGLKQTLRRHDYRRMLFFNGMPFQVWVCLTGRLPQEEEVRRQAEIACLIAAAPKTRVLRLAYNKKGKLKDVRCGPYRTPHEDRRDYAALKREAARQRARSVEGGAVASVRWG